MTVPIQFLWLSLGVLVILLPLTVYMATSGLRDRQVHLWCGGSLAMGIGFLLVSFRDHLSPILSFNVSQLLIICGYVVRTYALRVDSLKSTAQSEAIIRSYSVILALYYIVYCWLVYTQAEERIRLIFVYAFQVCLAVDLYLVSKRSYENAPVSGVTLITYMAMLMLATTTAKVITLAANVGATSVFQIHLEQYLAFTSYFLSYVFGNFGFVQLRMYKVQMAKNEALQKNVELERLIEEKNRLLRNLSLSAKSNVLGTMMASIAHELNQPLTAMQLNIQVMKRFAASKAEALPEAALEGITAGISRCAGIIKSLRSLFAREGMLMLRIDLAALLLEVTSIAAVDAKAKNITIKCDLEEGIYVEGEKHQLETVFFNLIHNAIEAMHGISDTGRITLKLYRSGDNAICEVIDTGVGIVPSQTDSIFDLYSSSKTEGMGLGLWLTRNILESHEATIIADPAYQGGAKFLLTFKLAPALAVA